MGNQPKDLKFEQWLDRDWPQAPRDRYNNGSYRNESVQRAWVGWQACRAAAEQPEKLRVKELERHLRILISLTTDLQNQLTNACEDFEGEQYIGEERDEDTAFIDAAREALKTGEQE